MPSQFIDLTAPSLREHQGKSPEQLPHGLIVPSALVREWLELERAKYSPAAFAKAEVRLLNQMTMQYHFDYLNHEVIYRETPEGPEVLAVGWDETLALKKTMPLEEQMKLEQFQG